MENVEVLKANGDRVPFEKQKLLQSLLNSGAQAEEAKRIVGEVMDELYPGIPTKKIYRIAFSKLKDFSRHVAARYNLKRAIMQLGPSGYPFEKYIGAILKYQGYQVQVSKIIAGQCVNHEVDVIAEKDEQHFMIECKYHNQQGIFCDVKIPLYIQSRFKDVEGKWKQLPGHFNKFHQGWVVTNTRFTLDAVRYGECVGLKLLGWDYPQNASLKLIIDEMGLYPLTCLTSLTSKEKTELLHRDVVLCAEVCHNEDLLKNINIQSARIKNVMQEGRELCGQLIATAKHHAL